MDKEMLKKWYSNNTVLWELLKEIRRHSTDFIGYKRANRFYRIGNFGFLVGQMKRFTEPESEEPYWHFFRSIAYLKMVLDKGEVADLNKDFEKCIYGYDIIFDFDDKKSLTIKERVENTKKEVIKVKDYFDKLNVPYILNFSGNAGFHIRVEWEDLQRFTSHEEYGVINKKIADMVIEKTGATICTHVLGGGRELIRVLYSIHPESGLVCYPLTDEEFNNFNIDMVNPENILKQIKPIKERQTKKRNGDLSKLFVELGNYFKIEKYRTSKKKEITKYINQMETIKKKFSLLPKKYQEELMLKLK